LGTTSDELFKRLSQTIPVRRMGQPNEIGDLCAYLCSPQAGYLTGQTSSSTAALTARFRLYAEALLPAGGDVGFDHLGWSTMRSKSPR